MSILNTLYFNVLSFRLNLLSEIKVKNKKQKQKLFYKLKDNTNKQVFFVF